MLTLFEDLIFICCYEDWSSYELFFIIPKSITLKFRSFIVTIFTCKFSIPEVPLHSLPSSYFFHVSINYLEQIIHWSLFSNLWKIFLRFLLINLLPFEIVHQMIATWYLLQYYNWIFSVSDMTISVYTLIYVLCPYHTLY